MGHITINGRKVEFTDEKNVLSIIRKQNVELPTLCYHSELSTFGACRLCMVENERGRMFASCSEEPWDGMQIYTNTSKLMKYRKMIVELLLASHCRDCTTCIKSGDCTLQDLAKRLGVDKVRFENRKEEQEVDNSSCAIVRDPNKCILCGDCVRVCDEVQGIGVLDFAFRGTEAEVMPAFNKKMEETKCVGCGQCRVVCPTAAITIKSNTEEVWAALSDPNVRVVAQVAPAVRVAIGQEFGLPRGENTLGKLVASLHRMGFEEVFDTTYGADLTVVEEAAELAKRLETGSNLPLLTSCCPAWVKFRENEFPELEENVSTCRSPQQMFGAVIKEYYKDEAHAEGKKTVSVSIMPCTAKKQEIKRVENMTDGEQDVDYVLTTTEVARMIKTAGIRYQLIESEAPDMPFGLGSGGGVIFGVTGGVTEAVLRNLMKGHSKKMLETVRFSGVRGEEGLKEASITLNEREVKIAVVSGLQNARQVLDKVKSGELNYDFIEVMACRRGCIMGGGQPLPATPTTKKARAEGLYNTDSTTQIKKSSENPTILTLYDGLLKGKEHKLLHTK